MGTASVLLNHQMTAGQALTGSSASPMASTNGSGSTSGSSSSSSDSATISANDFLTLLVTEMQNQDPTADTDPNEYINQLVSVNSLEQLIDINQTLTTDSTSTSTPTGKVSGAAPGVSSAGNTVSAQAALAAKHGASMPAVSSSSPATKSPTAEALVRHAPGNLAIPSANPSAHRVARALDGHSRAKSIAGRLPGAL